LAKTVLFDLLTSLCATGVVFLAAVGTPIFTDMRQVFLTMALLFVAAGFARGNFPPANGWLKALLLVSLCLLVFVGTPPAMLGLVAVSSYAASLAGIYGRRSWAVNRTQSVVTVTTVLAVIAVGSIFGAPVLASRLATRAANTPTPEFSITRLDGMAIDSSGFKGRVVVLDFWATWCPPCRQEFPELERLYRRYQANPNVTFLAIDVNRDGETPEKARAFVEKGRYTIPIAYDAKEVVTRLKAQGYPHLLLLDKTGHVRLEHVGYDGAEPLVENLSKQIDKLLSEPS
jgi:thiol-disulfide isomerase/thioredoxin